MLSAQRIVKKFGVLEVLKGIDINIRKGELVAVMGASGAGKSTLLQILGTLLTPSSGSLEIDSTPVFKDGKCVLSQKELSSFRNAKIGFVFQSHHLLAEFSALENTMIPALIAGNKKEEAKKKALSLLDTVGLSKRYNHKPSELSGGEQQRVAIARALVNSPAILLCDEPTGSLDSRTKQEIHALLSKLRSELGQTIIIVTHDSELAAQCDRTIHISDGLVSD